MESKLTDQQDQALQALKTLVQDALNTFELPFSEGEAATIWGVPLLGDKRSDVIILKFLKAKDFVVSDAFAMIKNTLRWRKDVGMESLLQEDLGDVYGKVLFTHGLDREGYPVWYLVLEELLNSNLCHSTSSEGENQHKFFCWLIQFVEMNIRRLDFRSGGANTFTLVIDLKIPPWHGSRGLYKVIDKLFQVLEDFYPESVTKQFWINASWWYRYYCRVYSLVFDRWSMNNTVIYTGSTKTTDTLFRYISPAQVPLKYGGLSRDDNRELSRINADDTVSEVYINPDGKHIVGLNFAETCDVLWDLRVIGWDVTYEAEFVPNMKGRYITIISKQRKLSPTDKPIISDNFRVSEPGKLVLTIRNATSKKKRVLTRVRVNAPDGSNVGDEASLRGWLV